MFCLDLCPPPQAGRCWWAPRRHFPAAWLLSGRRYLRDVLSLHSDHLLPQVSRPALPTPPAPDSHFLSPSYLNPFLSPVPLLSWVIPAARLASRPAELPAGQPTAPGHGSPPRPRRGLPAADWGRRGGPAAPQAATAAEEAAGRPPPSPRRCRGRSRSRGGWGRAGGSAPAPPPWPQPAPARRPVAGRRRGRRRLRSGRNRNVCSTAEIKIALIRLLDILSDSRQALRLFR